MRNFRRITALVLMLVLVLSWACAAGEVQVQIKAEYKYSDARKMLSKINSLRTGSGAWYIAQNNRTRVKVKGLKPLEYDYNLERVAMQRALELAVLFSHTRPNGAAWSSLYPKGYSARGENVAYGFGSVTAVFNAFAEENANYAGQGHRRNMLNSRFTRVGFGAVKVGNVMYWVQEFGCGGSKGSDSNRYKGNSVRVSESTLKSVASKVQADSKEIILQKGKTAATPTVTVISRTGAKMTVKNGGWKAGGSAVTVKNTKITGVKNGSTKLTATVAGKKLTVAVNVVSTPIKPLSGSNGPGITIEDYEPALGTDFFFLEEDDECFEADDE